MKAPTRALRAMAPDASAADTLSVRLMEREDPLASLDEYAREARSGDGRVVLVTGEAGVGKSTVVEQLERDRPEARWFWGACDGQFTSRPLGPLFDFANQLGGELVDLCRDRAPRGELFHALLRGISASDVLTVVVLEDLHWADEATVDLLRFVGRRLRNASVLVIATYRDDGLAAGDPLRVALGELASQRTTRRIGLAPLSEDAVGVLAQGSGIEPSELFRLIGGNPFFVTEVVQAGTGEVPESARDAALARAVGLSAEARTVLDVAALIGAKVELRLLESVTSCDSRVMDELSGCGLLRGDGSWLRFRHEIARIAVQDAIAAHRRRGIHARILDALRSSGTDDDASLAFHAEAAGDVDAALHHAHRAARLAGELGSHREAATQYERALRAASGAEPTLVATLYEGLAKEMLLLDRWQVSEDASRRALAVWRSTGDRLRKARLSASWQRACGGSAEAWKRARRPQPPSRPSNHSDRASSWRGRTPPWQWGDIARCHRRSVRTGPKCAGAR